MKLMPNQLANETSPYLRQHQDNPVEWYPWNETALAKAKQENKPIFLSIGYAACHWCHVMAHESFEDIHTAQILNENFVNIKVDREERPDLDDIYMQAVVMLTGQGGWPLSIFLTPDLQPFYGGTYFPPLPRHGLPSFTQVLTSVIDTWKNNPDTIIKNAEILTTEIRRKQTQQEHLDYLPNLDRVVDRLHRVYDWQTGGWGNAPKFPQPMLIEFLIHRAMLGDQQAKDIVVHLLKRMAQGGMFDLVGGGFHRYSTDKTWLIPHFEKMLYDNAQLALVYLHGYALTGEVGFLEVVNKTLSFIQREMTNPDGAFYASMDADTPEGEGRYYAWELEELREVLTQDQLSDLKAATGISARGNFVEALTILQRKTSTQPAIDEKTRPNTHHHTHLDVIFNKLLAVRNTRIPPEKDKKIITEWNAMTIRAFAEAGLLLNRADYVSAAKKGADFLLKNLRTPDGSLHRSWNEGRASHPGTLTDYAGLIAALQSLYVIDFDPHVFKCMQSLFITMQEQFSSEDALYFDAAADVSDLIVRPRNLQDNATPSGNAVAAYCHWLFANYNHEQNQLEHVRKMIAQAGENIEAYPTSFGFWLQVAGLFIEDTRQIAIVSHQGQKSLESFLSVYRKAYRPFTIIAAHHADMKNNEMFPAILEDRTEVKGKPTAYVCQGFICRAPVTNPTEFEDQLE
jgi:uncharacterized protein